MSTDKKDTSIKEQFKTDSNLLELLPPELRNKVLQSLTLPALGRLSQVSSQQNEMVKVSNTSFFIKTNEQDIETKKQATFDELSQLFHKMEDSTVRKENFAHKRMLVIEAMDYAGGLMSCMGGVGSCGLMLGLIPVIGWYSVLAGCGSCFSLTALIYIGEKAFNKYLENSREEDHLVTYDFTALKRQLPQKNKPKVFGLLEERNKAVCYSINDVLEDLVATEETNTSLGRPG